MGKGISIINTVSNKAASNGLVPETALATELRSPRVGAMNTQGRMVVHALRQCLDGHTSLDKERVGLCLGTACGANTIVLESLNTSHSSGFFDVPASWYATGLPNSTTGVVASLEQLLGPNVTLLGEQSGFDAIIMACRMIRFGHAEAMIAGAFDTPVQLNDTQPDGDELVMLKSNVAASVSLLLLVDEDTEQARTPSIIGWSSKAQHNVPTEELVRTAIKMSGQELEPNRIHTTVLDTSDTDVDYMAATAPLQLIDRIVRHAAAGTHAFIVRGFDKKSLCLLLNIPHHKN